MTAKPTHLLTQSRIGLWVLALSSLLQGCSANMSLGGQTGGEVNEPLCVEEAEAVSWSDSPLGFSAAEAAGALRFGETLTVSPNWLPPADPELVTYVTPTATTTLSFVVEQGTNEVQLVHSRLRTDGSGPQNAVGLAEDPCRDRLELQVHVRMTTPTGELNEAYDATLRVYTLEDAVTDATLDATRLAGNLNPTTRNPSVDQLNLALRLRLGSATVPSEGSLALEVSTMDSATASSTSSTVATW